MPSDKNIVVYVARHGTTELNQQDCFRGKVDVALDKAGVRDAHRLAYYFKNIELCGIVSSDRLRARQTAEIICRDRCEKPIYTEYLRAWNVGVFSGKPKTEENVDALERYVQNPDKPIPEGESLNAFKDRIRPCLTEAIKLADESGKPIMVVAHSSIVHETGDMFHGNHEAVLVEPGGVAAIYFEGGQLKAAPILKTRQESKRRADTIS